MASSFLVTQRRQEPTWKTALAPFGLIRHGLIDSFAGLIKEWVRARERERLPTRVPLPWPGLDPIRFVCTTFP